MNQFEEVVQKKYFSGIGFSDERERQVFLSYIRGFSLLTLDSSVKKILEIGGGQSTTLLSQLGERLRWEIITIDMNPEAIASKIRSQSISELTLQHIQFRRGVSINIPEIQAYFDCELSTIGGVPFDIAIKAASKFIDTAMDGRKAPRVAKVLGLEEFNVNCVIDKMLQSKRISFELMDIFRTPRDELEFYSDDTYAPHGCLREIMEKENIDAVFLDSGEFSSLPEWEIVQSKLRPGGYVVLHDIFFPKSFKNWIVCGSIMANEAFVPLYIDNSTPQGLMVAQKKE